MKSALTRIAVAWTLAAQSGALALIAATAFFAVVAGLGISVAAQTISTLRAKHNARVCALAALPADCKQADFDATGKASGTIYTTDASFRDAVIVPRVLAQDTAEEINEDAAIINAAVVKMTKAQRRALCTSIGVVC